MTLKRSEVRRLKSRFGRLPRALYEELRVEFKKDGLRWRKAVQNRLRGGNPLHRRSGRLARSIRSRVRGSSLSTLMLRNTSEGVPYARIHEFGGVIRPKKAKALTIPIDDNLTPAGNVRWPTAAAAEAHFGDIFLLRLKSGGAFLVARTGFGAFSREAAASGTDLKFLFILKRRVTIPPRLGFFDTWNKQADTRKKNHELALVRGIKKLAVA